MMTPDLALIEALSLTFGPSGMEERVAERIRREITALGLTPHTDCLGNVTVQVPTARPNAPTLLLQAHMDEVGVMITDIHEDGLLSFAEIGGLDDRILPGRALTVLGHDKNEIAGVITKKPVHLLPSDERKRTVPQTALSIDIGARDRADAQRYAAIGDCAVFASPFIRFGTNGTRIKGKALDDRIGCAILIQALRHVAKTKSILPSNLVFAFTVREETGLSGAALAVKRYQPELAIAVETTAISNLPHTPQEKRVATVGGGCVLSVMDRSTVYDRGLLAAALQYGEEIPLQLKKYVSGGNDAAHMQRSTASGARVLALNLPTRYLHSAACVADLGDYTATGELLLRLICEIK